MVGTFTSFIGTWDSGQPGATWDSGLQWDVNTTISLGDPEPYLARVTSEHRDKPLFMATLRAALQPIVDLQANLALMSGQFDLDAAAGAQLDDVGRWVGVSRQLRVPLSGVFFTWGAAGLGWGQGAWHSSTNPTTNLFDLPDAEYRTLIRSRIANNHWDGTVPGAYAVLDPLFASYGVTILIQDYANMHMLFALDAVPVNAVITALFQGGYLNFKPAGVHVDGYATPSVPATPYFGFGANNANVAGWGTGAWGKISHP